MPPQKPIPIGGVVPDSAIVPIGGVISDRQMQTPSEQPKQPKQPEGFVDWFRNLMYEQSPMQGMATDALIGAAKGAASTVIGMGALVNKGATAIGLPIADPKVYDVSRQEYATPSNAIQSFGKGAEQVAELMTPTGIETGAAKVFTNAPRLVRTVAKMGAGAVDMGTKAAVQTGGDTKAVTSAAVGGAATPALVGVTKAVAEKLGPEAQAWMQSALKPSAKARANEGPDGVPKVVTTLLKEGVSVTKGGSDKLEKLIEASDKEIDDIILRSTGYVDPVSAASRVDDAVARASVFEKDAAEAARTTFLDKTKGSGLVNNPPMTVQQANDEKKAIYAELKNAYGQLAAGSKEGRKAVARGLKEEVERALAAGPNAVDIKPLNARLGALIEAQKEVDRYVSLARNRDPGGLAWIANNAERTLAILLARDPAVKSLIARGMWDVAGRLTNVPPSVIKMLTQTVAMTGREDK